MNNTRQSLISCDFHEYDASCAEGGARSRQLLVFWSLSSALVSFMLIFLLPFYLDCIQQLRITLTELIPLKKVIAVYSGDTAELDIIFVPESAAQPLNWSVSDESVASVGEDGSLISQRAGETSVFVTAENGISAAISVVVLDKPLPPGSDLPADYSEPLLIANVTNPLPADYKPELVNIPASYHASIEYMKLTPETLAAFELMYADAYAATGREIYILSGYRSYNRQVQLFEEDVLYYKSLGYNDSQARELTGQSTQIPGCSEHQLGNSMDIGSDFQIDHSFYKTKIGAWVTAHAHEYGFILRYPANKTAETGIDYEAWHFRYVGVKHAEYIHSHGLCLEEYVQLQAAAREEAEAYSAQITAEEYLTSVR